jgi:hypothetical protein
MMTLAAGILAFVAVQLQMRDQRRTLREEQETQKRAVAKAILFEIDGFYRYHLRGLRDYLKSFDLERQMPLPVVKPIETNPFSIYEGNAGRLGELEPEVLQAVVEFYNAAGRHVSTRAAWKASIEGILAGRNNAVEQEATRRLATEIQKALPLQIGLAWLACRSLSKRAGARFEDMAVSKEFDSPDQIHNMLKATSYDTDGAPD